jgi:multidrug resistance protein
MPEVNANEEAAATRIVDSASQNEATAAMHIHKADGKTDNLELRSDPMTDSALARVATKDRPYSSFTSKQKIVIVLVATLGGSFSPFTANIYFPAIDTLSKALNVSVSQINLTVTTYMIFQGLSPSFTSAIADDYGRRPGYIIGFSMYMLANLGLALNNSYAGLLVLRCLQSAGSSGLVTLQQGTIADVVTSAERGKYIAITSLSSVLAPSVGPILGGVLAQNLGWHWIFWLLLIMSGVYFAGIVLFFPETCRAVVGDGSLPPPKWNRCLTDIRRLRKHGPQDLTEAKEMQIAAKEKLTRSRRRKFDVLGAFLLCFDRQTAILLLFISITYAGFYMISVTLTVQFGNIYGLSTSKQGLLFIPQAVGSIMAAVTNAKVLDWSYKRHALKAGLEYDKKRQGDLSKMPIEKARLDIGIPYFTVGAILIIIYGWLLEARVNLWAPIVVLTFIGYATLGGFSPLMVLFIDLHRSRASTATAANNLARCLLGAGATAVANPLVNALGNGWTFTLVGLVELACVPLLWFPYRYGMQWRAENKEKEEEKRRKVEEKARQQQNV